MPMGYGPLNTPSTVGSNCKTLLPSSTSNLNRMRIPISDYSGNWVKAPISDYQWHLRPVASCSSVEHGPDTPARAEQVEGLGEAVVVNDPSVDWEDSHQQDDVASCKHHAEHLPQNNQWEIIWNPKGYSKKKSCISALMNINLQKYRALHSSGAGVSPVRAA